jgi:hypothetical protein
MSGSSCFENEEAGVLLDRIDAAAEAYAAALLDLYGIKAAGARFDAELNGSRIGHALNPLYMDLLASIEAWRIYSRREEPRIEAFAAAH